MGAKFKVSSSAKGALGPGPGGYDGEKIRRNHFSYSMSQKLFDVNVEQRNFVPGPGRYESIPNKDIPSTKFGTGKRTSLEAEK